MVYLDLWDYYGTGTLCFGFWGLWGVICVDFVSMLRVVCVFGFGFGV